MENPLNPSDGRQKVNRDRAKAEVAAILKRWNATKPAAPLIRARRDKRFQAFVGSVICQ